MVWADGMLPPLHAGMGGGRGGPKAAGAGGYEAEYARQYQAMMSYMQVGGGGGARALDVKAGCPVHARVQPTNSCASLAGGSGAPIACQRA
jgi:hypothetical protein